MRMAAATMSLVARRRMRNRCRISVLTMGGFTQDDGFYVLMNEAF
jgi:hypothetical protein